MVHVLWVAVSNEAVEMMRMFEFEDALQTQGTVEVRSCGKSILREDELEIEDTQWHFKSVVNCQLLLSVRFTFTARLKNTLRLFLIDIVLIF